MISELIWINIVDFSIRDRIVSRGNSLSDEIITPVGIFYVRCLVFHFSPLSHVSCASSVARHLLQAIKQE